MSVKSCTGENCRVQLAGKCYRNTLVPSHSETEDMYSSCKYMYKRYIVRYVFVSDLLAGNRKHSQHKSSTVVELSLVKPSL